MNSAEIKNILLEIYGTSGDNCMEGMPDVKIFDEPIMGVACADDGLFDTYKDEAVIGPWHMLPGEWLNGARSVVSFFFPFSREVRESNYAGGMDISYQWLYGRIEGQGFINSTMLRLKKALEDRGIACVVPSVDARFMAATGVKGRLLDMGAKPGTFSSNWSERHAAYACGLGSFGLSKGLITEKGMAGRFASIIVDAELEVTERPYSDVYEYCSRCGACLRRCPVGAISMESGKDHSICGSWLDETGVRYAPRYGCGLCQTRVPCEFQRPQKA